jgi:L-iditol 2-dehydrogenase
VMQRVSVLDTDLTLRIEEREIPEPGPDEILVQVKSVGVCGSDIHYFEHGRIADFVVEQPLVLGHEASGVIAAVGASVTDLEVGTTVAMEPGVPCGRCHQCRAGHYNLCPDVEFFATPPIDGAFCEYVILPRGGPGRIRTCDARFRKPTLYPLSYGAMWHSRIGQTHIGGWDRHSLAGINVLGHMYGPAFGGGKVR